MIREAVVRAIHRTFPLQCLGDGVPVRVVILDAMRLHPIGNRLVRPGNDITNGVQLLPELHSEPVLDALMNLSLSFLWQEVVAADIDFLEAGDYYLHLVFQRLQLWCPFLPSGRFGQPHLHDVSLCRVFLQLDGRFSTTLMDEPLQQVWLQCDEHCILHKS